MDLTDYEPTAAVIDHTPRPKASQTVAAAKRAAQPADPDELPLTIAPAPLTRQHWLLASLGVLAVVGVLGLAVSQLSMPARPLQVTPAPTMAATDAPAQVVDTAPTPAPAPTTAPTVTIALTATTVPTEAPPVGRGLTLEQEQPTDPPPPEPTAAPSYLDNVGAQAPHSPRGGLCGPTSGDCAPGVPAGIDNNLYIANVGAQAPHKVR